MNKPVSFELAKLLKEKGFDEPCCYAFNINGVGGESTVPFEKYNHRDDVVAQPTIAEVVMWCFKTHKIWIQLFPYDTITAAKEWTATILSLEWGEDKEVHYEHKIDGFKSPTEAYEAAIEYTLLKLI